MSDKVFIGRRLEKYRALSEYPPVDRVLLTKDSEHYFRAPNVSDAQWNAMTGYAIEAECPYATQAMANALLSRFSGFVYKPYEADGAELDPAAELGDAVTINGEYHVIVEREEDLSDADALADLKADGDDELDNEYPYIDPIIKTFNRELSGVRTEISILDGQVQSKIGSAQAQSLIDQTIDGITLSVTSSSGGSKIALTSRGVTIESAAVDLHVKSMNVDGSITADAINLNTATITGTLSADHIDANIAQVNNVLRLGSNEASQSQLTFSNSCYMVRNSAGDLLVFNNIRDITLWAPSGDVELTAGSGHAVIIDGKMKVTNVNYGTSLPASGEIGQIFFLI